MQPERLNPMALNWDAIVRSTQRKVLRSTEMIDPFSRKVTTWLRHTAGCSFNDMDELKLEVIDLELLIA